MELKAALKPETWALVEAEINAHNAAEADKNKHIRYIDLSEGNYVSKDKYTSDTERYKTQVNDLNAQIKQRDTDLADVNAKLTAAQADSGKLQELQTQLTAMSNKYEQESKDHAAKLAAQAYEFAVKQHAAGMKFTSSAARKQYIAEVVQQNFKMDGDSILGITDFDTKYKTDDPGAFEAEKQPDPAPAPQPTTPQIVAPTGSNQSGNTPSNPFNFHFTGVRPTANNG